MFIFGLDFFFLTNGRWNFDMPNISVAPLTWYRECIFYIWIFKTSNVHGVPQSFCFTVRAWSLTTFSNVAVYRGHKYPIWDLDVSPFGVYFCTASKDQTARLWSPERTYPIRVLSGHLMDVDVSIGGQGQLFREGLVSGMVSWAQAKNKILIFRGYFSHPID